MVSLSAVTWGFPLVGRTRMLTEAWLAAGVPTTFVQAPSYRTAAERLLGRHDDPGIVVRPWPAWPSMVWMRLSGKRLHDSIRSRARALRRQLDRRIDWSSAVAMVVSPVWAPWLDELPFARVVYDCIDDLGVHVPRPGLDSLYRRWESDLIARANAAAVTARALGQGLLARRPGLPVRVIRNGVDVDSFLRRAALPRPDDLPRGRPIVGFVGALYSWMNWGLVERAARALPHADFVLVGPWDAGAPIDRLRRIPNLHLPGQRAYRDVPRYIAAFDACWVPFDASRVSMLANPVKIYEYLALGKPVVTTPVADVESFDGLVGVARDDSDMIRLLALALAEPPAAGARIARERFARDNAWVVRGEEYVQFARSLLHVGEGAPGRRTHAPPVDAAVREGLHDARAGRAGHAP